MTNFNEKRIIPIVFAIDDKYAPFLSVTLSSILANNNKNSFFKFYILYTDLSKSLRNLSNSSVSLNLAITIASYCPVTS